MGERLASPPLIEALCEFRFKPTGEWDWTLPGRMFDKIGAEFSQRTQVLVTSLPLPSDPGQPIPLQTVISPDRVQLRRPDGSAMVQIGSNLLAINQLRPYQDWVTFRTRILNIHEAYVELSGQSELERIGLRYINQIALHGEDEEIARMITVAPPLIGVLKRPLAGFYQRYELLQECPKGVLIHQTGKRKGEKEDTLILDLDLASTDCASVVGSEAIGTWLDQAHDRVYEAFVASLTQELYERLRKG